MDLGLYIIRENARQMEELRKDALRARARGKKRRDRRLIENIKTVSVIGARKKGR